MSEEEIDITDQDEFDKEHADLLNEGREAQERWIEIDDEINELLARVGDLREERKDLEGLLPDTEEE